ncbi:MAG: hypothetical protein AAB899_01280, partial [Patescibacteria group bacterium]
LSFAEKNNLMPEQELASAKKFLAAGGKGPGGCTGKDSCEAFCNDIANIDECVAYAEKSGIMQPKELDEAKKVQAAIKRGVKPPPCGGKKACDSYCDDPNHIEECVAFASEAGFMSPEEQANAQKMVQAIKSGVKPLPCKGKEECDEYCGQEQNIEACIAFAEAAGFMSNDEAKMAKKTRGKGPGGCKGKEQCDAFCDSSPENQGVCFQFAKDNGLIPPEELQRMEEGDKRFRDSLSGATPETIACLENIFGKDNFEKLKAGAMRPTRELGEKMSVCFRQEEEQRVQMEEQNGDRGPENFGPQGPGEQGDFGPENRNDRSEMRGRAPFNGEQGRGPEDFDPRGSDERGDFQPRGPNEMRGRAPFDGEQIRGLEDSGPQGQKERGN